LTEAPHIPLIVEVHAEDAAILWLQRDRAVDAPNFSRRFLSRLDERLEAHLDGLRVAGKAGWDIAKAAFEAAPEPGEAFMCAVLAFEGRDPAAIATVLEAVAADGSGRLRRAVASGLGWIEPGRLRGLVQPLLDDPRPAVRALGLAASSVHRGAPREQLARLLHDPAPEVRGEAAKLAGVMGRVELLAQILADPGTTEEEAFLCARAAVLLGDRGSALAALRAVASQPGPRQRAALELFGLAAPPDTVRHWLATLGAAGQPLAVQAAGLIGLPDLVPWLIEKMGDAKLARAAGQSLALITGVDLDDSDLSRPPPDDLPEAPNDDPADGRVALDPDEELSWPAPEAVAAWWRGQEGRFASGARYFLGQPASRAPFLSGFESGTQVQRRVAALALVCAAPGEVLANWRKREPVLLRS